MRVTLLLLALCACIAPAYATPVPRPTLTSTLSLAGATSSDHHESAPAVLASLRVSNALGLVSFNANLRHVISNTGYWKGKCRFVLGLDCPIASNAVLFVNYEQKYRDSHEDFTIAGVQWKFGSR